MIKLIGGWLTIVVGRIAFFLFRPLTSPSGAFICNQLFASPEVAIRRTTYHCKGEAI